MEDKNKISKSKAFIFVVTTAIVCIIATGYISNYFYKQKIAEQVFTFIVADTLADIRIARSLREGEKDKVIKFLDSKTGRDAITFTNYNKYAPKNLHKDILETLLMIQAYRNEYNIQDSKIELF